MENTSTETPVGLDVEWILEGVDLVSECGDVCQRSQGLVDDGEKERQGGTQVTIIYP
jgi:hypothetical protein